jgi:hypothetical protein
MTLNEGRQLRDEGTTATLAAATAGHKTWKPKAEAALTTLINAGTPFTAADLRRLTDEQPDHPNQWGAIINVAARRKEIRKIGYTQSPDRTRHAGAIAVWIAT